MAKLFNLVLILVLLAPVILARDDDDQDNEVDPNKELICPEGTLNAGWSVTSSGAFPNPADCCDQKTVNWELGDSYDSWYMETGCGMARSLVGQSVHHFIFPVMCDTSADCGETSPEGTTMECCKSGFCAALSSNGTSRCQEVTELWTYDSDYESNSASGGDSDYAYTDDEIDAYLDQCEAKKSSVCLGCADDCTTIGGIELWNNRESSTTESSNADSSNPDTPNSSSELRALIAAKTNRRFAVKRSVARKMLRK